MTKTMHTSDTDLLASIEADTDEPIAPAIDGAVLRAIAAAHQRRDDADADLAESVATARDQGLSWAVIGSVLGMSRQGALQRYGH